MLARLYESSDAATLDLILGQTQIGDVRLDRDRLCVVGRPPVGLLVWRPGGIVHELRTGNGLAQRRVADLLVNFAVGDALSGPFNLWEAVFVTDNEQMAKYALELGAVEEIGKRVFTLPLRAQ